MDEKNLPDDRGHRRPYRVQLPVGRIMTLPETDDPG